MRGSRGHLFGVMAWLMVLPSAAIAQEPTTDSGAGEPSSVVTDPASPAEPTEAQSIERNGSGAREGLLDRSHDTISGGIEAFISRVDGLFAGSESHDAPTGSYIRAGGEVSLHRARHGGTVSRGFISVKIRLPRTSDRLQLVIDQGIESITRSASQKEADRSRGIDNDDEDVFIGLRGIAKETLKISLTSDVGLRFHGLTPDPYVRGRALRVFEAGEWKIPLSETLLWRENQGFTAASELVFLREVAANLVFSAASNATFVDSSNNWVLSEVLALSHRMTNDALLSYEAGAFGDTRPDTVLTAYTLAVRYRQRYWRDWIIGEIRPQFTFPRERDFNAVPSLTFRLEAHFGKGKLPVP